MVENSCDYLFICSAGGCMVSGGFNNKTTYTKRRENVEPDLGLFPTSTSNPLSIPLSNIISALVLSLPMPAFLVLSG